MEELRIYDPIFKPDFRNVPKNSDYGGVIVEPRKEPHLDIVLRNFAFMMPSWSITIFHSEENESYIRSILGSNHQVNMIKVSESNMTIDDYNQLLMSESFYDQIGARKIIIFQCDSFIRRKMDMGEFMQYHYIGAPCGSPIRIANKMIQPYNGGLSFRCRDAMVDIIRRHQDLKDELHRMGGVMGNEDIFFSIGTSITPGYRMAPLDVAISFSVESIYHYNSFGWHKAYQYLPSHLWNACKSINLA